MNRGRTAWKGAKSGHMLWAHAAMLALKGNAATCRSDDGHGFVGSCYIQAVAAVGAVLNETTGDPVDEKEVRRVWSGTPEATVRNLCRAFCWAAVLSRPLSRVALVRTNAGQAPADVWGDSQKKKLEAELHRHCASAACKSRDRMRGFMGDVVSVPFACSCCDYMLLSGPQSAEREMRALTGHCSCAGVLMRRAGVPWSRT